MKPFAPLLVLVAVLIAIPASAQLGSGPRGDFRPDPQLGTAPTVGMPGGPSLPAGPVLFPDPTGTKRPEEILRDINKELGSRTLSPLGGSIFEPPHDFAGRSSISSTAEDVLKR